MPRAALFDMDRTRPEGTASLTCATSARWAADAAGSLRVLYWSRSTHSDHRRAGGRRRALAPLAGTAEAAPLRDATTGLGASSSRTCAIAGGVEEQCACGDTLAITPARRRTSRGRSRRLGIPTSSRASFEVDARGVFTGACRAALLRRRKVERTRRPHVISASRSSPYLLQRLVHRSSLLEAVREPVVVNPTPACDASRVDAGGGSRRGDITRGDERKAADPLIDSIRACAQEDSSQGDVTTESCVPEEKKRPRTASRRDDRAAYRSLRAHSLSDPQLRFDAKVEEGARVAAGTTIFSVSEARAHFTAERRAQRDPAHVRYRDDAAIRRRTPKDARRITDAQDDAGPTPAWRYAARRGGGQPSQRSRLRCPHQGQPHRRRRRRAAIEAGCARAAHQQDRVRGRLARKQPRSRPPPAPTSSCSTTCRRSPSKVRAPGAARICRAGSRSNARGASRAGVDAISVGALRTRHRRDTADFVPSNEVRRGGALGVRGMTTGVPEDLTRAADAIRRAAVVWRLVVVAETESTNDDAKRGAREARRTARHGSPTRNARARAASRTWISPREELLFSVVCSAHRSAWAAALFRPRRARCRRGALGDDARVLVKWPNDVVVRAGDDRLEKSGVLVESQIAGGRVDHIVVGIGINVHTRSFPPESATSLAACGASTLDCRRPRDHDHDVGTSRSGPGVVQGTMRSADRAVVIDDAAPRHRRRRRPMIRRDDGVGARRAGEAVTAYGITHDALRERDAHRAAGDHDERGGPAKTTPAGRLDHAGDGRHDRADAQNPATTSERRRDGIERRVGAGAADHRFADRRNHDAEPERPCRAVCRGTMPTPSTKPDCAHDERRRVGGERRTSTRSRFRRPGSRRWDQRVEHAEARQVTPAFSTTQCGAGDAKSVPGREEHRPDADDAEARGTRFAPDAPGTGTDSGCGAGAR